MGQQQLLLIVLGVIIIGIAIAVSFKLFRAHSIDEKRNLLTNEGASLATLAMSYYKKPAEMGGGGRSFINWTLPDAMATTATGRFTSIAYDDSVVITAIGNEVTTGNDSVKVQITVLADNFRTRIIN